MFRPFRVVALTGNGHFPMHRLNYYWRVIATGFCFSMFGLGGLFIALTFFPVIKLLPINTDKKRLMAQRVVSRSFCAFIWLMQTVGVLRVSIKGSEKLQLQQNHLLVANHPTLIDVILLISLMRETSCIVKQALWENPFLRGIVKGAGYINSEDTEQLLNDCVATVENGESLIVFPEGSRTVPGESYQFQRGAANIALRSQKDITPVYIECVPTSLTKNERWYQVPKSGPVVMTMTIGDSIDVSGYVREKGRYSQASRTLTQNLKNYFTEGHAIS